MRLLLAILLLALLPAPAQAQTPARLEARGAKLYWGSQEVRLVGTNADNINALGANIGSNRVSDVRYTEADYRLIRSHGANHVRFGLSFSWYKDTPAAFWAMTDAQVRHARAAGLWIVWNMFTTPGNCYEGYGNSCGFWNSGSEQAQLTAFWVAMAQRYKDEPAVAGYDLLNEPTPGAAPWCARWWDVAGAMVRTIRLHTDQLIFLNTCSDAGGDLQAANLPRGENIVYEVHMYAPMDFTHDMFSAGSTWPGTMKEWFGACYVDKNVLATGQGCPQMNIRATHGLDWAAQNNVPIYIGEWGAASVARGYAAYTRDVAELFRDWGVSHAHYTWQHQTIKTGGFYQWGIAATGSQAIDDPAKLEAVKVAWAGAFQPVFDGSGPQPPAEGTATATAPTATPRPATRTPRPATAVPATAAPASGLRAWVEGDTLVVETGGRGLAVQPAPDWSGAAPVPSGCADEAGGVVCWAPPATLRLALPPEWRAVAVQQGGALVVVVR